MKYLFVYGKEGRTPITTEDRVTNMKEMFTDFLAFYNKDGNLVAIISKSEIIGIFTIEKETE